MNQQGEIMISEVQWMLQAYPNMADGDRMQRLEVSIREVEHMGKPAPHCNHTVVDAHLAELPEELKETLKKSLLNGIFTGIKRPDKTTTAKASLTAIQNGPAVWKQMRKFAQHGWVRAFPAELRETISSWVFRLKVLQAKGIEAIKTKIIASIPLACNTFRRNTMTRWLWIPASPASYDGSWSMHSGGDLPPPGKTCKGFSVG